MHEMGDSETVLQVKKPASRSKHSSVTPHTHPFPELTWCRGKTPTSSTDIYTYTVDMPMYRHTQNKN